MPDQLPSTENAAGVEHAGVIDLFAVDAKRNEVLLVMNEPRPWDDSDLRLHQLQEKFNAYVSFLLDGEMLAAHPELAGKRSRIELHCDHMPDARALELLNLIHDQIALQEIAMEVIVADPNVATVARVTSIDSILQERNHRCRIEFLATVQELELDQKLRL